MSELPVDEKDAPEGYYAVGDEYGDCEGCAFRDDEGCCWPRCTTDQRKVNQSVVFKNLPKRSTVAEKKLYIHSEEGHVILAFEGELQFLPRITIPNYVDAPAKDIAEHMMAIWNENANKLGRDNAIAVDPNEAPEGYVAVEWESGSCKSCAFNYNSEGCPRTDEGLYLCSSISRKDNTHVYFVKKPESTKQDSAPTIPLNVSLRDFFAGCAISGCMNASEEVYKVPERAYIVADMMLAEREKSLNEWKGEK